MLIIPSNSPDAEDVLLLDSFSGKQVRGFSSGFGHGFAFGVWSAQFIGQDRFVVTPGFSTDAKGHFSVDALRLLNLQTGRIVRELTSERFGPTGNFTLSTDALVLGMLNVWRRPRQIRHERHDIRGRAQILFFHLEETRPFCVLDPLPDRVPGPMGGKGIMRFSSDLSLIAISLSGRVTVYEVSNCGLTAPAEAKRF